MAQLTEIAQAEAAAKMLPMSMKELQRHQDNGANFDYKGYKQQLPKYTKLTNPENTKYPLQMTADGKREYHSQNASSECFIHPYNAENNGSPSPYTLTQNKGIPGKDFAKSGDIREMNAVTFTPTDDVYSQIANDIKDMTFSKQPDNELTKIQGLSVDNGACPNVYGASHSQSIDHDNMSTECSKSLRGFLYDLLHFNTIQKIRKDKGLPNSTAQVLEYIIRRDNRTYYLLFVLLLLILVFCLLKHLISGGAAQEDRYWPRYLPLEAFYPFRR